MSHKELAALARNTRKKELAGREYQSFEYWATLASQWDPDKWFTLWDLWRELTVVYTLMCIVST